MDFRTHVWIASAVNIASMAVMRCPSVKAFIVGLSQQPLACRYDLAQRHACYRSDTDTSQPSDRDTSMDITCCNASCDFSKRRVVKAMVVMPAAFDADTIRYPCCETLHVAVNIPAPGLL